MATQPPTKTIAQVFEEFLAEQETRISAKTFAKYESIISLYRSYLESYWPGHDGECDKVTKAGGKYCTTYGAEEATEGYSEFLGYFMPRKVMCGNDLMQAAGTVTKKLAKWLVEKGYIEAEDTEYAQERAGSAAKDLPKAQKVLRLLDTVCTGDSEGGKVIEDHFYIDRIEPGKLWLAPMLASTGVIGPIRVPTNVSELCGEGWDIGGIVEKVGKEWHFVEVWNVSP